jgi:hypothetical protein
MEKRENYPVTEAEAVSEAETVSISASTRLLLSVAIGLSLAVGLSLSFHRAHAEDAPAPAHTPKVVYPEKTELDFEGTQIEGEVRNPGEFYFQHRDQEKFDSLVQRRKNFHREMLRDVVLSK